MASRNYSLGALLFTGLAGWLVGTVMGVRAGVRVAQQQQQPQRNPPLPEGRRRYR